MLFTNLDSKQTIVGFNTGNSGSCCIIHKNKIISIGEERLNRKKFSQGYMSSFLYCLNALNINRSDIDLFVASSYHDVLPQNYMGDFKILELDKTNFTTVDHHLSHAYTSYFLSPFDEAIIVVCDGSGNVCDTESYYIAKGFDIQKVGGNNPNRPIYNGIGRTYETFTNYCGWVVQEAGKTMGLASFGNDKYPNLELYNINDELEISSRCEGKYYEASLGFCEKNGISFGKPFSGFENKDAAFFVQDRTEKVILELVRRLYNKYKIKNICLAGGTFLNSIINAKILKETEFENVFIAPCCDDKGQAIGNALYGYHKVFKNTNRFVLNNAYSGRDYTEAEILDVLEKKQKIFSLPYEVKTCNFKYKKCKDIAKQTAQILKNGNIIGWFQGSSEFGPRALGNRSILCSPYPAEMKEKLNARIKHREMFRPFAPAIMEEHLNEYFNFDRPSPYMLNVVDAKKAVYDKIPATLHVDNTARVQTVNKKDNGIFYDLINEFYKLTNVPVLLNTSFNDSGEPIIENPKDALTMFVKNEMDYLILNDYLVWKE